jgi:hypothetical protein
MLLSEYNIVSRKSSKAMLPAVGIEKENPQPAEQWSTA